MDGKLMVETGYAFERTLFGHYSTRNHTVCIALIPSPLLGELLIIMSESPCWAGA